jgi:hypothetical protein
LKKNLLVFIGVTSILFSDVKLNPNTSLNGLEHSVRVNISLSKCATLCEKNKLCKGINYHQKNKRCGLLKSYTSRVNINGIISGVNYSDYNRKLNVFDSQIEESKPISQNPIKKEPKTVTKQENQLVDGLKKGFSSVGNFFSSAFKEFEKKEEKPSKNNVYDAPEFH